MSLRYRTGLLASRIGCGALLVATLLVPRLHAQNGDGMPFESVVDQSSYLGQTPLRVWHRTRGYGEETAETAFGTHWATPTSGGLAFMDGQFRVGNADQDFSVNLGGGFRWRNDDAFTGSPRILGASFWFDGEDTQLDNWFNQLGVSFERLGPLVDLRLNANIPLEDVKAGDDVQFNGDTAFTGNTIAQTALVAADASLRTVDFEIAPRLFNLNAWAYAGGYQMDGDGVSEFGAKGGVRGYLYNDLVVDVGVNDDDQFGTTTVVQVIWTPGRVSSTPSNWSHNIDDRMREQVYRNSYVAVARTTVTVTEELTDVNGDPFSIVHVDSSVGEGGDGTIENPYNDLADVNTNTNVGDIIFVHSESQFTGQSVTLKDAQRFLGEGNNEEHLVVTSEVGEVALPESAPGAGALAKPQIIDAPGEAAILLAGLTQDIENTAEIEVSNFTVDGGARAIYSPTGVGDVNINRMMIQNIAGDGNAANFSGAIELKPLVETLADNSKRVRFTPTISEVMFTGSDVADNQDADDDIRIDATTAEPGTTPITETIALSDITITGSNGVGIRLVETKRAATITDYVWNGETTGNGALLIDNTVTTGTVTMNGVNSFSNGQAVAVGTSGPAFGIRLDGGAATHTVTGTTINNMGGDAVVAVGGTAGLNFTGHITQTVNAGSILDVSGGHDGNMTFVELTANEGIVDATTGDGLQFNDADGVYTFTDNVAISGVAAGGATSAINVVGDSTAAITLADATIANINGDAIRFVGGTANLTLTGTVTQTLNASSILDVSGGHDGTLDFNEITANAGVINATIGDGLQFDNADGTYTFDDKVTLNGSTALADTGIDVLNDSEGTFAFTEVDIDYANNAGVNSAALRIEGSEPQSFSMAGNITSTSGRPVILRGNTGGSVTITAGINANSDNDGVAELGTDSNGILIENNTSGTYAFSGLLDLNTDTQTGLAITGNTGGTFNFSNVDIDNTSGDGVVFSTNTGGSTTFTGLDIDTTSGDAFVATNTAGHAISVTGTDNRITTTTGTGINMNTATVGASGINFRNVNATGATNAIVLNNVTGGAINVGAGLANAGDGGVITTTGSSVLITNVDSAVTLNRMDFNGATAGDAISVTDAASFALTNSTIDGTTNGDSISIEDSTAATLTNVTIGQTAGTLAGRGVFIDDTTTVLLTTVRVDNTTADANGATVDGAVVVSDGTTVTLNGVDVNTVNGSAGVVVTNNTNTTLTNVDVNDTDVNQSGIEVNHDSNAVSNVTISSSELTNIGGVGIDYNRNASATSRLTLTGNTINTTAATALQGININIDGSADTNITINGGNQVNSEDEEALLVTTAGNLGKIVRINVTGNNNFSNNDTAQAAASFVVNNNVTFNANVTNGNSFNNANTGRAFTMTTTQATSNGRLNLDGNDGNTGSANDAFLLTETAGDFDVVGTEAELEATNTGGVEFAGNPIQDIPGPVPLPQ